MRFRCSTCGEEHQGMPSFGWDFPVQYLAVPEAERAARCVLTSDACEIDGQWFFVRGCLEIPGIGRGQPFSLRRAPAARTGGPVASRFL